MLIALLAVLGVDLIVIVVLLGFVLTRRRWIDRQPGAFKGAIRLVGGELDGIAPKWRRGYGRWIRDVFVWSKGPFLFRNELLAIDAVEEQRTAAPGEVKRLGDNPRLIRLKSSGATVEVATRAEDAQNLAPTERVPYSDGPYPTAP